MPPFTDTQDPCNNESRETASVEYGLCLHIITKGREGVTLPVPPDSDLNEWLHPLTVTLMYY